MPQVLPSASPTVGEIIDAIGPDGRTIKVVAPGVLLLSGDGSVIDATGLAAIGATDDPAWNGSDDDATVISLLKAIALNTAGT